MGQENIWGLTVGQWTVVASLVNAISVVVLVVVTIWYAKSTASLLAETRRQADVSEANLRLNEQQTAEKARVGAGLLSTVLTETHRNISNWKNENVFNLAALKKLPPTVSLRPNDWNSALHHARGISEQGAQILDRVFNLLGQAEDTIQTLQRTRLNTPQATNYAAEFTRLLEESADLLESAMPRFSEKQ